MCKTVRQVAELTGISVRTLHYYDEIGLLKPSKTTDAGYRLYDDKALELLQQILFFRELDFSLKQIQGILADANFDKTKALKNHRKLLALKRSRLDNLIALVDKTIKGDTVMSFKEFDTTEIESAQKQYAAEAKEKYGGTAAYQQSQAKTASYGKKEWSAITAEAEALYNKFAAHMDMAPSDPAVQQLTADWQAHITRYYYDCTNEILAGLGEMYVSDPRFTRNIDRYGKGLARFMSQAIQIYCQKAD